MMAIAITQIVLQLIPMVIAFTIFASIDRHWAWIVGAAAFFLMALRRTTALLLTLDFGGTVLINNDRVILPFTITVGLVIMMAHVYRTIRNNNGQ